VTLPAASTVWLLLSEEAEEAAKLWGLPIWVWQLLNLGLFLGVLLYFIAKPLAASFRQRQEDIERRRLEAEKRRESVDRLAADIRERASKIEREIEEIRKQGRADGEEARRALGERALAEAERIREQAVEEVERRFAAARAQLREQAAELTTHAAGQILSREITPADRERLLADGVERLKDAR